MQKDMVLLGKKRNVTGYGKFETETKKTFPLLLYSILARRRLAAYSVEKRAVARARLL